MLSRMVRLTAYAATAYAFALSPRAPLELWSDASNEARCHALWAEAPQMLSDLEVYTAERFPNGTTFSTPYASLGYSDPVPNLSAFCRFGGWIHTSDESRVQFEVWLPEETWNGRFAMVGNGGDAGGVNYPQMGIPMSKYGFAVASTDTGHNGTGGDGTFVINNTETQIDFGYRAVHLTTVYSQKIVETYYKKQNFKSYWLGCSSGGKQGLKEVQMFPNDYDGVLAGAAAQYWSHLNGQTYRINAIVNPVNTTGHLTSAEYKVVNEFVVKQCDGLDGVEDGLIVNPQRCKPNIAQLDCSQSFANQSACLNTAQIETMYTIWSDWASTNGTWLFPGFEVGSEGLDGFSVTGEPYGPGPDYFRYQVLNKTTVGSLEVDEPELERLLAIADLTDPGQTTAIDPHIQDFLSHGKLITYVGLSDTLIPSGSSIWYWHRVRQALGFPEDLDDSYRMFAIPGMGHCRGGPGAWCAGQAEQEDISLGGATQSVSFDASHDMILALIDWVEKGKAPDHIIGAKYIGDDKRNGTAFTRKLCPYPQEGVYVGGDTDSADSFECRYNA